MSVATKYQTLYATCCWSSTALKLCRNVWQKRQGCINITLLSISGIPAVFVSISLGIATGINGIDSFVNDK